MRPIILGTAGHIDHGKTALIKALTGRDTDRLAEEKRRGITIDLGFTWMELPDGRKAGVIDVPGHEKFIRNMAAGVGGMDLVLLVIAADEGVMPQTEEHLAILRLLGVEHFIVVLNKCDLTDEEWTDMVEEQIREELADLLPEDVPFVRVSAKTGAGIDVLRSCIAEEMRKVEESETEPGLLRLPVDRAFTMSGFGTVVTGTMLGGRIRKDDSLAVYPSGICCRVRGIQVYGEEVETCIQGQRTALNLAGTDREAVRRGSVLALPGSLKVWRTCHARLRVLKRSGRTVKNQTRLHFYSQTSELLCRAVLLDAEKLGPGESGYVRLVMESDAVLCPGDRFVVRFYSPVETIGGGVILETDVRKEKRFSPGLLERLGKTENASPVERAAFCLENERETLISIRDLAGKLGVTEPRALELGGQLEKRGEAELIYAGDGTWIWSREKRAQMQECALQAVQNYMEEHPYRQGMPSAMLLSFLLLSDGFGKADRAPALAWIGSLTESGILERKGSLLGIPGWTPLKDENYERVRRAICTGAERAGYAFAEKTAVDFGGVPEEKVTEICTLLKEQGKIVEVVEDVWTTPEIMQDILQKLNHVLDTEGRITISGVRDMLGTGRKNARRILEYTDRTGLTRKDGGESERVKNQ